MEIILAKNAGFCFGVKRAVELVFKTARKHQNQKVFTLGPIIHNPQVLELLKAQGVNIINRPQEAPSGSVVVIRAHGVPLEVKKALENRNVKVIDATCPRVIKVQKIIEQFFKKGYQVIIVGEKDHPEVKGLLSYAAGQAWIITRPQEVALLPQAAKVLLVAQTTQNEQVFQQIAEAVKKRYPEVKVFNTICHATHNRQQEVRRLASKVQAFVVVGGKISGNTRRLAQIAAESGIPTYHIETEEELPPEIAKFSRIAVTAGASTPYWLIRRVIYRLEEILLSQKSGWTKFFYKLLKFSLATNLVAAIAGAALTLIGLHLGHLPFNRTPFIAFFYLWAMHLLNHLTDFKTTFITDPDRFGLYSRFRKRFWLLGSCCLALALMLAAARPLPLIVILGLSLLGLLYNVKLPFLKVKLKYLPGSKTIFVPLTWGFLASFYPCLLKGQIICSSQTIIIFVYLSAVAFVRTCIYDLLDIQGDQMLGKETLPIALGEKRTFKILYAMITSLIIANVFLGLSRHELRLMLTYNLFMAIFLFYTWAIEHKHLRPGLLSDAMADGLLILMGAATLV